MVSPFNLVVGLLLPSFAYGNIFGAGAPSGGQYESPSSSPQQFSSYSPSISFDPSQFSHQTLVPSDTLSPGQPGQDTPSSPSPSTFHSYPQPNPLYFGQPGLLPTPEASSIQGFTQQSASHAAAAAASSFAQPLQSTPMNAYPQHYPQYSSGTQQSYVYPPQSVQEQQQTQVAAASAAASAFASNANNFAAQYASQFNSQSTPPPVQIDHANLQKYSQYLEILQKHYGIQLPGALSQQPKHSLVDPPTPSPSPITPISSSFSNYPGQQQQQQNINQYSGQPQPQQVAYPQSVSSAYAAGQTYPQSYQNGQNAVQQSSVYPNAATHSVAQQVAQQTSNYNSQYSQQQAVYPQPVSQNYASSQTKNGGYVTVQPPSQSYSSGSAYSSYTQQQQQLAAQQQAAQQAQQAAQQQAAQQQAAQQAQQAAQQEAARQAAAQQAAAQQAAQQEAARQAAAQQAAQQEAARQAAAQHQLQQQQAQQQQLQQQQLHQQQQLQQQQQQLQQQQAAAAAAQQQTASSYSSLPQQPGQATYPGATAQNGYQPNRPVVPSPYSHNTQSSYPAPPPSPYGIQVQNGGYPNQHSSYPGSPPQPAYPSQPAQSGYPPVSAPSPYPSQPAQSGYQPQPPSSGHPSVPAPSPYTPPPRAPVPSTNGAAYPPPSAPSTYSSQIQPYQPPQKPYGVEDGNGQVPTYMQPPPSVQQPPTYSSLPQTTHEETMSNQVTDHEEHTNESEQGSVFGGTQPPQVIPYKPPMPRTLAPAPSTMRPTRPLTPPTQRPTMPPTMRTTFRPLPPRTTVRPPTRPAPVPSRPSKPVDGSSQGTTETIAGTNVQALTQQIRRLPAVLYVDSRKEATGKMEKLLRDSYGLPLVSFYVDKIDRPATVQRHLQQLTAHKGMPYLFICGTFIGSEQHIDNYHKNGQMPQLIEYVCGDEKKKMKKGKNTAA